MYANIIVDISHENLDRTFSYRIPDELEGKIAPGVRVLIPFGSSNRRIAGYVLSLSDKTSFDDSKIKSIISIEKGDEFVESKMIILAKWMKDNYGSTMINALKTVLPVKNNVKETIEKQVVLRLGEAQAQNQLSFYIKKHQVARLRLLEELIKERAIDYKVVTKKLNISPATLKLMMEQGVIDITEKRKYRNPVSPQKKCDSIVLNDNQKKIVADFIKNESENKHETYLIHGITGSGKTLVYMEMIEEVLRQGKSAIVLIPEIALTYQTVMRFYQRFGDKVSTLHSRLSKGEKYDQFERAKKGDIRVMIGPRSALFTPFKNLGLIVIDEEHESSYKSDTMPKYHAREVAAKLCSLHNASLVLGSATPSLESYYRAKQGEYKLYTLNERAAVGSKLPKIHIVDLREELKNGNKSIFSVSLSKAIQNRLDNNEQVMLFLNRRGMDGAISCRSCGKSIKCPHCDITLSRHANGRLICHYCGYEIEDVKICPSCGSPYISGMRAGTQKVEQALKKQFPMARILRMDYDTTRTKGSYDEILSKFANREADILIGTQMIVKGHDFPYVTLMGILAADMSLNASDYRACERTFQLLTQAAGRAGRADKEGDVYIQTYQSEHYAIEMAKNQDYEGFYEQEMAYRSLVSYPPAGHMLAMLMESEDEEFISLRANSLAEALKNGIINSCMKGKTYLVGPSWALVGKINDIYRKVIYVKSLDMDNLVRIKDEAERLFENEDNKRIRISFDFDPMNGY